VELAKQHATGNHETWAEALNVGVSTVARAFAGNHADRDYFVSFRSVPMLCVGMRSPFLLFWAMARFFHLAAAEGLDISGGPAVDPARAMQYLARMTREMSEAIDAVAKGAADGKWTLEEVRECEREVGDLLMLCHALLAGFGRLRAGMECD
jgi:NTP pyrophosphatase (non-canonical NTP hydrolase)